MTDLQKLGVALRNLLNDIEESEIPTHSNRTFCGISGAIDEANNVLHELGFEPVPVTIREGDWTETEGRALWGKRAGPTVDRATFDPNQFKPGDTVIHGNAVSKVVRAHGAGVWEIGDGNGLSSRLVRESELSLLKLEV
jgi:hypothetical protein